MKYISAKRILLLILHLIFTTIVSIIGIILGEIESVYISILLVSITFLPVWLLIFDIHKDQSLPASARRIAKNICIALIVIFSLAAILSLLQEGGIIPE